MSIQGLQNYSEDQIIDLVYDFILQKIEQQGLQADFERENIKIHGSRKRMTARPDSDLDIVFSYTGNVREDDMFNALNDNPLYIDGIRVDINPIEEDIDSYMTKSALYDKAYFQILNREKEK